MQGELRHDPFTKTEDSTGEQDSRGDAISYADVYERLRHMGYSEEYIDSYWYALDKERRWLQLSAREWLPITLEELKTLLKAHEPDDLRQALAPNWANMLPYRHLSAMSISGPTGLRGEEGDRTGDTSTGPRARRGGSGTTESQSDGDGAPKAKRPRLEAKPERQAKRARADQSDDGQEAKRATTAKKPSDASPVTWTCPNCRTVHQGKGDPHSFLANNERCSNCNWGQSGYAPMPTLSDRAKETARANSERIDLHQFSSLEGHVLVINLRDLAQH